MCGALGFRAAKQLSSTIPLPSGSGRFGTTKRLLPAIRAEFQRRGIFKKIGRRDRIVEGRGELARVLRLGAKFADIGNRHWFESHGFAPIRILLYYMYHEYRTNNNGQ
jgi:hypothetical protein